MRFFMIVLALFVFVLPALAQEEDSIAPATVEVVEEEVVAVEEDEGDWIDVIFDEDEGLDVSIQVTNNAEYRLYETSMDNFEKMYGMQTFEDDLSARIQFGDLVLGGTIRFWQPGYDNILTMSRQYKNELHKWYFGYSTENVEAYYGTMYTTLGRGLTLHLYDDPIMEIDNFLNGFYGSVDIGWLNVKALVGRGSYDYNADTVYEDDIRAVEVSVNPYLPWVEIGAGLVSQDQVVGEDFANSTLIVKPLLMPSGHLSVTTDYVDLFAEYAISRGYESNGMDFDRYEGSALYASLVGYLDRHSLLLEYKDYDHFYNHWNAPPECSFSGKPLEAAHSGGDEKGYRAVLTVSPIVGLSVSGGYADAWNSEEDRSRTEYGGEVRWDSWPFHVTAKGYLNAEKLEYQTDPNDPESYFCYTVDQIKPELEASYTFKSGHSLTLHYLHEIKDTRILIGTSYDDSNNQVNPQAYLTYNWSGLFSATLSFEKALEDVDPTETRDYWLTGQVTWHLGTNHDLTLFYGNERGGEVCSGGVCRTEPPFDGLKILLETSL